MLDIISDFEHSKMSREGFYVLDVSSLELVDGPFATQDEARDAITDNSSGDLQVLPMFLPRDAKGRTLDYDGRVV